MTQENQVKKRKPSNAMDENGSDTEMIDETIDVTFEFCDLNPIDYHAIKHLISQLLRINSVSDLNSNIDRTLKPSKAPLKPVSDDIDLGELTDIILGEQKEWVGATVKCDDENTSDPYAFASILDLRTHQDKKSVAALTNYLKTSLESSSSTESLELRSLLTDSLKPNANGIGLLLSERLINMPVQVIPQLLSQLGNEIKHAQSKNALGFEFDRLLIISRVFSINSDKEDDPNPTFESNTSNLIKSNKKKPKLNQSQDILKDELGLYHPEDSLISQFASHTIHFDLKKSDQNNPKNENSKDFGVEQRGRLMLIELSKWDLMIEALKNYVG